MAEFNKPNPSDPMTDHAEQHGFVFDRINALNQKFEALEATSISPAEITDNQLLLTSKINEMEASIKELQEEIVRLKDNTQHNLQAVEWKFVGKDVNPHTLNSGEFTYTITREDDDRLDLYMRKYDKYGNYFAWNMTRTTQLKGITSIHDHNDSFLLQADADEFRTLQGRETYNYYNQVIGYKARAVKTLGIGKEYVIHIPGLTPQFVYSRTKNQRQSVDGQEPLFPDNVEG